MTGNASVFMKHLFELVSGVITMRKTRRRSYITCYQKLFVLGNYAAGAPPFTGRPFRYRFTHFHEIFIPAWSFVLTHFQPLLIELVSKLEVLGQAQFIMNFSIFQSTTPP
jgi:hypothetical protein